MFVRSVCHSELSEESLPSAKALYRETPLAVWNNEELIFRVPSITASQLCNRAAICTIGVRQFRSLLNQTQSELRWPTVVCAVRSRGRTMLKRVLRETWDGVSGKNLMDLAAGLSYYFILSFFPLLILAAAIVSFLPIPNLFDRVVAALAVIIPEEGMGVVRGVLKDVVQANRGSFLTIGLVGVLWSASGGFVGLISALNVAYDAPETRPFWKRRLLALQLAFATGLLLVIGVTAMFLGPEFGEWVATKAGLSSLFARVWPILRWSVAIAFIVLAVELIFYWAPNVRQRFLASLPGALVGVVFWIAASYALGLYFQNFAHFNKTYGALGAAITLMVWLYWSWFIILVGAELNLQLLKARGYELPLKQPRPPSPAIPAPADRETGRAA
jgi:membrane protein